MKQTINILIMVMAVIVMSCSGSGSATKGVHDDGDMGFARTMSVADSLYGRMLFRDAYDLYLQLLNNKEVEADSEKRLRVLDALCNVSELSSHKDKENEWLQQLLDLATATHNDYYRSSALMAMGRQVFFEGDREKGIRYVGEAIGLIARADRPDADHLTHGYLNVLTSLLSEMKDFDRALQTVERNLQLTMQGTRWGAVRNQQLKDRRMALAKKAALLARTALYAPAEQQGKLFLRADSAYAAWRAVEYEGDHTRDYFIVDYMRRRGRYTEAIGIYNDLINRIRQEGDTLGEMMNTAKWGLADVYHQTGHCEQAAALYVQVLEIQDTLKSRKARNTAQQLAAVYHDKEQDEKIMQQEAENTRQKVVILMVVIVLIAVAALAAIVLRKNRIISRKNRIINSKNQSLARQIAEAMDYKERYLQLMAENTRAADEPTEPDKLTDEQLFQYINDIVASERLFLNPDCDRQMLMQRFQLSKARLGAAFSKGSQYANVSDYMQQLRLEYSTILMTEQPDKSIVQIATESGFSSYDYFGRCFRKRFGMTPTEFRQSVKPSA